MPIKKKAQHGSTNNKKMIFSETAPMNFSAGQNANGTEPDETVALWVNRLFELISYEGPLPNEAGDFGP